jgi:hypothetical protein
VRLSPTSLFHLVLRQAVYGQLPPGLALALSPLLEQIGTMTVKIKHSDRLIEQLTKTQAVRGPRPAARSPRLAISTSGLLVECANHV